MEEGSNKIIRSYYTIKDMPNIKFGNVLEACTFRDLFGSNSFAKTKIYSNGNKIKNTFYV